MNKLEELKQKTTSEMRQRLDRSLPDGKSLRSFIADLIILHNRTMRKNIPGHPNVAEDAWYDGIGEDPWYWGDEIDSFSERILYLLRVPEDNEGVEVGGTFRCFDEQESDVHAVVGNYLRDNDPHILESAGEDRDKAYAVIAELTDTAAAIIAEQEYYGIEPRYG